MQNHSDRKVIYLIQRGEPVKRIFFLKDVERKMTSFSQISHFLFILFTAFAHTKHNLKKEQLAKIYIHAS